MAQSCFDEEMDNVLTLIQPKTYKKRFSGRTQITRATAQRRARGLRLRAEVVLSGSTCCRPRRAESPWCCPAWLGRAAGVEGGGLGQGPLTSLPRNQEALQQLHHAAGAEKHSPSFRMKQGLWKSWGAVRVAACSPTHALGRPFLSKGEGTPDSAAFCSPGRRCGHVTLLWDSLNFMTLKYGIKTNRWNTEAVHFMLMAFLREGTWLLGPWS